MSAHSRFVHSTRPRPRRLAAVAWWWGVVAALIAPVSAFATGTMFSCPVRWNGTLAQFQCQMEQSACGTDWVCVTLNKNSQSPKGGCWCWPVFPKADNSYATTGAWSCAGSSGLALNSSTTMTLTSAAGNVMTLIDVQGGNNDPNTSPSQTLTGASGLTGYVVVALGTTAAPDSIPVRITGMNLHFASFNFRGTPSGPNTIQLAQGGGSIVGRYNPMDGTIMFNNAVPCVWSNALFTDEYFAHPAFVSLGGNQFAIVPAGVTAFDPAPPPAQETISASAGSGGTITPSGAVVVSDGASQSFTIAPNDNCHVIASVIVDGSSKGAIASYTFTNVLTNHAIVANFTTLGPYAIGASADAGASIAPTGGVSVACGGSQTFTIAPNACHAIQQVTVDGTARGALTSYTFSNVHASHTIQVTSSTLGPYSITATAGANGQISPSGNVSVPCGGDQSFTMTADPGYVVQDVVVDGSSIGPVLTYTFTSVTDVHTIGCFFKIPLLAPPYEPDTWNDGAGMPPMPDHGQPDNNCYNYATNQKTGHFSQPGQASGHPAATFDCAGLSAAAVADGLVATDKNSVCNNGYKIALVFGDIQTPDGKEQDFHWYRQDANGNWSHKPGETEATNKDASNNPITDPETADKGKNDDQTPQYANFCGYFCVTKTTVVNLAAGGNPNLPAADELRRLLGAPRVAARPGPRLQSNQVLANPIATSGLADPITVFTAQADLDSITSRLTGLTTTADPQWPSQLGYRGFHLELDDVAPVGSALVRVWNGVVRIDQGSSRNFYSDSKQLENWLALRVYGVLVTGVADGAPGVSRLTAPLPNPFRTRSSIGFALDHGGRVRLRIYDIVGRVVRNLVDADLAAGRHDIVWNGLDESGAPLRSGTYFYRLSLDGRIVGASKTVFLGR